MAGDRKIGVQSLERDAHDVDYAHGGSCEVSRVNTPERVAFRKTILSMLETTPATVARPGAPGTLEELLPDLDFDWQPRPLGAAVISRRQYRWPIVIGALLIGGAVLFVARFLVLLPADQAEERLARYAVAVDEFAAAIDAMESAATLTDPVAAGQFLEAADALREVARPRPPGILPFIPAGPVTDVRSARHRLIVLADAADSIAERLATAARYRAASQEILDIPLLPFSAPPELIDPAARALADMQATSEAAADGLDDEDEEYAAYRESVDTALATLTAWIDRYLLALRRGSEPTAATLVAQLHDTRDGTLAAVEGVLDEVETEAAALITELRRGIEDVRIVIGLGSGE
jgi:hypothetical protein